MSTDHPENPDGSRIGGVSLLPEAAGCGRVVRVHVVHPLEVSLTREVRASLIVGEAEGEPVRALRAGHEDAAC